MDICDQDAESGEEDEIVEAYVTHRQELELQDRIQPRQELEVRLAAAVRLRSAVALELVAGKVLELLDTVQLARGIHRRNGTGSPCMG